MKNFRILHVDIVTLKVIIFMIQKVIYTSCPIILKKNNGIKVHKSKVDFFKKKPVSQYNLITIDSGSSHNFINDVNIMDRKDNCLQEIPPSQNTVSLADGSASCFYKRFRNILRYECRLGAFF
jgi:hypothetical protein